MMKMKYSIIVCNYNGVSYIDDCLSSLINQTYINFEVIVINDGSTDSSLTKLKKWEEKYPEKIKVFDQENQGLSASRNRGVQEVTGDYLLFVDIDDTLKENTLETLENQQEDTDLIKFQAENHYPDGRIEPILSNLKNKVLSGEEAFCQMVKEKQVFEMAQLYAYRTSFWKENQFTFAKDRYHEDFGLIPYVIIKSKSVKFLNEPLYQYRQTDNSITRNKDYEKTVKRAKDILFFQQDLWIKIKEIDTVSEKTKHIFKSFIANAVISQVNNLQGKDREKYIEEIKEKKILEDLSRDSLKQKLKYNYLKKRLK